MKHTWQGASIRTYSIRKFTVGVASIAIVAFLLGSESIVASAQEEVVEPAVVVEEAVDDSRIMTKEVKDVLFELDEGTLALQDESVIEGLSITIDGTDTDNLPREEIEDEIVFESQDTLAIKLLVQVAKPSATMSNSYVVVYPTIESSSVGTEIEVTPEFYVKKSGIEVEVPAGTKFDTSSEYLIYGGTGKVVHTVTTEDVAKEMLV